MYRKYQNSTKSWRNERLAQLSEQESVIEKKKREILAKFEAQKKKEKEEALQKLESASMPPSADKKHIDSLFPKHSFSREKEVEIEEPRVACPRNAFSNDGSFLDQFKKLSSELGPKKPDLSIAAKIIRSCDMGQKLRKDCDKKNRQMLTSSDRREHGLDEFKESSKRKLQKSNFQHQQSPSELVQFGPHLQISESQCRKSNSEVLHFAAADAQSKVISCQNNVEAPVAATDQNSENVKSDVFSQIQILQAESTSAVKPQLLQTTASLQDQVLSTPHFDMRGDEESDELRLLSNITENMSARSDGTRNEWRNEISSTLSYGGQTSKNDEFSRVSPALTDCEAGSKDEVQATDAVNQECERAGSCTEYSNDKRSTFGMDVPVEHLPNEKNIRHDREGLFEEMMIQGKTKFENSDYDSIDSNGNSKDSCCNDNVSRNVQMRKFEIDMSIKDGYQADCDDEISSANDCHQRIKKTSFHKSSSREFSSQKADHGDGEDLESQDGNEKLGRDDSSSRGRLKRKRKSRWGDEVLEGNSTAIGMNSNVHLPSNIVPVSSGPGGKTPMLSKLTRSDPGLMQYARQTFGSTNLSEDDWKKAEDHYKINLLYQDMVKKRAEIDRLEKAGKFKYEYDSDEDVEGGTWEHKLRQQEMMATQLWAEELTRQAAGKHHIGDFLPPEELERFMEKYNAVKQGRNPDLSDYKEFKLKEDNVGYRLLQKMGWNEGQGLGQDGTGITNPVNKASTRHENQGLGVDRPDGLQAGDDEYDAYRKRMMLAYRFRPNPLNNPRRPYY